MNKGIVCALASVAVAAPVVAQTNLRAYYAKGQAFIVWQTTLPHPTTYEIYRSTAPFTDVSQGTLVGRLFQQEWEGERLDAISNPLRGTGATWKIPIDASGGTYTLAADEGLFVYTPHAASSEYFAIVKTGGSTAVTASNGTVAPVAVGYDPVNDPVTCHEQFSGTSPQGYPYVVYALWCDGRDDVEDARPDYPVTANAAKNGHPQVFAVHTPVGGPGTEPYPAVFALHGGEGNFHLFRPGLFPNIGLDITEGILIAPSDNIVFQFGATVRRDTTGWIGHVSNLDPFDTSPPADPPAGSVLTDYTIRRFHWLLDWFLGPLSGYAIDPTRVSVLGHSAGGRGASMITRVRPERFAAVYMFTPALKSGTADPNPLHGSDVLNLATSLVGPGGTIIHKAELLEWSERLSPTERDFPFTRIYSGLLDPTTPWNADRTTEYRSCNDSAQGFHLFWDERDHGIAQWSTDEPSIAGVDIGQWVSPVRTEKATAQSLHRFRNDQSFPAFFDDDQDALSSDRQPDIGTGDPNQPPPYGTWSGYYDWNGSTIVDTTETWACTVYLTASSPTSIDNAPYASSTTSVALRRTQRFRPAAGTSLSWVLVDDSGVVQSGSTTPDADGLVRVTGLTITADTDDRRLIVSIRPCLCIQGNVDTGAGGSGPANVLLLNGSAAPDCGRFSIGASDAFRLEIVEPPSRATLGARYWLGAWIGTARTTTVRSLPAQLGSVCMPMQLTGGVPQPRFIANNVPGSAALLGAENWPGPATQQAPYVLLNLPMGVGRAGARVFFQGIVRDDRAPGNYPYAVTNGIQLEVDP